MAEAGKKIALITGANRGIGFETARQLGQQGVTVVLGARRRQDAEYAAGMLKGEGLDAYGIKLDVTDVEDRRGAAAFVLKHFGRLDILINNAGRGADGGLDHAAKPSETSPQELEGIFATNLFAVVYLTGELLPLLHKSDAGRIVNLSSILGSLGLHADPTSPIAKSNYLAYDASKSALNAYTLHLAKELKDTPIKVNSAHPGWVKTEIGGDRATMEVVDGARTSVALALLGPDGPSGRFLHMDEELPW
jgi:NAD(P)-dependent dehydrogenase (short-subunit alcohol dehydrogenase family)